LPTQPDLYKTLLLERGQSVAYWCAAGGKSSGQIDGTEHGPGLEAPLDDLPTDIVNDLRDERAVPA
jgi:hypothetical protein